MVTVQSSTTESNLLPSKKVPLEKGGECGYTTTSKGVKIDWDYGKCGVSPTMVDDQIVYSVALSSPGNAPGYETIEFYVDTAVDASCAYDSKERVEHFPLFK